MELRGDCNFHLSIKDGVGMVGIFCRRLLAVVAHNCFAGMMSSVFDSVHVRLRPSGVVPSHKALGSKTGLLLMQACAVICVRTDFICERKVLGLNYWQCLASSFSVGLLV